VFITKIEWRGVKVPYGDPDLSGNRELTLYALLLWLQTDDGLMGVGEASPPGSASEERIAEIGRLIHDLAPSALGLSPNLGFDVISALAPRTPEGDVLRFGLETATLDLQGQQALRPIEDLLDGVIDWVPMSADISFVDPQEAVRQAVAAVDDGYECIKISIGSRFADVDVEVVRQVREAIGYDVALRADADEAWSPERAIEVLRQLEPFNLEFIEQPVPAMDLAGLAAVRSAIGIPVAADEAVGTIGDARQVIDAGAADVLVVKPIRAGGIRAAQAIMSLAAEHGLRTVVASSMETGVGLAAGLHVASCLGEAEASALGTGRMLEHDLLKTPLVPVRGHITVPQTPGLGVEIDRDAVDRYTTGVMGVIS
jgi:o-succinylbenzoate synthase